VRAFEASPPRESTTTTVAVPAVWMSAALICDVTCDRETYVVGRAAPFHCTTDVWLRDDPLIVSVNAAPPAATDPGERSLIVVGRLFADTAAQPKNIVTAAIIAHIRTALPKTAPPSVSLSSKVSVAWD
jgi:hypothetical protein